jgi:hypothetical protein
MSNLSPVPNSPNNIFSRSALISDKAVKPATPDLIETSEEPIPIDVVTQLLFEDIGSVEILSIARSDIINGRNVTYGIIPRLRDLSRANSPDNIFRVPGAIEEYFKNFALNFPNYVPDSGTAPLRVYILETGASQFSVLDRFTDESRVVFSTLQEAESFVRENFSKRSVCHISSVNGNLIVDVDNLKLKDRVEVEILRTNKVDSDTIY